VQGDPPTSDSAPRAGEPTGLGPVGWLLWVWRSLTTMRTALVLLLLLALAAVPGSLVPQEGRQPAPRAADFRKRHPDIAPVLDRLGFLRRLLVALVRRSLPAALHLARRLHRAPDPAVAACAEWAFGTRGPGARIPTLSPADRQTPVARTGGRTRSAVAGGATGSSTQVLAPPAAASPKEPQNGIRRPTPQYPLGV